MKKTFEDSHMSPDHLTQYPSDDSHDPMTNIGASTGALRKDYLDRSLYPSDENMYNRSLTGYVEAINQDYGEKGPRFDIHDWTGKRMLDIGSGAYESFALDARHEGVQVYSVNPALVSEKHRFVLTHNNRWKPDKEIKRTFGQKVMRTMRNVAFDVNPGDLTVAGLGQELPFRDNTFDGLVSVFGVPHYLVQAEATTDDDKKIELFTPGVRSATVREIEQVMSEIARVLKPGGKAYLVDSYRAKGQTLNILGPSAADGTELIDALESTSQLTYEAFTKPVKINQQFRQLEGIVRTTVLTKT